MIIQIVKCENPDLWYSEAIGRKFNAFEIPSIKYVTFVNLGLFVLNSDIKILSK